MYFLTIQSTHSSTIQSDEFPFFGGGRRLAETCRLIYYIVVLCVTVKGKAVPLQAWNGPESSRKLRFPDFMTTAQGGGKVVSLTHRPHLPPGNPPGTHFC